jgi:putative transposase
METEDIDYKNYVLKIRIYPNLEQKSYLHKAFGCSRFIYNYFLDKSQKAWNENKEYFNCIASERELTKLSKQIDYNWLKEVDSQCLKVTLKHLDTAYKNLYQARKEKRNYNLRFKSKKIHRESFTSTCINSNVKIDFENKRIKIPKLKSWIKYRDEREAFDYKSIQKITIKKTPAGNYFAAIHFRIPKTINTYEAKLDKSIGIDFGLKNFITLSNGEKINSPECLKKSLRKLKRLNKSFSKKKTNSIDGKKVFSSNKEKARIKLAKCYEKISNQRKYFNDCLSKRLLDNYDFIFIEDLNIQSMQKLWGRKVSDIAWSQFVNMLTYKALERNKYVFKIDKFYPSSKLCHNCGYKNEALSLNDRKWICPVCHSELDRDINASKNILKEGLRKLSDTDAQSGI